MAEHLYKYLPPSRIDVLRSKAIRVSQPCALNDPHDTLVTVRSHLEEQHGDGPVIQDDFFVERLYAQQIREDYSAQIGIISLSVTPVSTLMWAHYAESHTGFLIHFNQESSFFLRSLVWVDHYGDRQIFKRLPYPSEVRYENTKEQLFIEDGIPWDFLFRKSDAWAYEEEYRSLMNLDDGKVLSGTENFPWPVYLVEIPEGAITGVTLGLACSPELREEIVSISSDLQIDTFEIRNDHLSYELAQRPLPRR